MNSCKIYFPIFIMKLLKVLFYTGLLIMALEINEEGTNAIGKIDRDMVAGWAILSWATYNLIMTFWMISHYTSREKEENV